MAEAEGPPTPASHLTAAPGLLTPASHLTAAPGLLSGRPAVRLLSGRPAVRLRSFSFLNFKTGPVLEPYS